MKTNDWLIGFIFIRSAHGFSDTDMESLIGQLRREEDNIVRHRGLVPGTENQTFEMTVPSSLRTYYRRVMAPLNNVITIIFSIITRPRSH